MRSERGQILLYSILALAILAALGALTYWADQNIETSAGVKKGESNIQEKWDAANAEQRKNEMEKAVAASLGLETGNAKAKVIYRTITNTVDKYIDRPIYRNICFDADGLRDANAALSGAFTPASQPNKSMPKPDATR